MFEFALNPSETRVARAAAPRNVLRPLVLSAIGAGALAGFAVLASSVIGDLVAAPVRPGSMLKAAAPVIDGGLASKWPDLKDGLPSVAGSAPAKVVVTESAPRAEPVRMAALAPPTAGIPNLTAKPPAPAPVAVAPEAPTQRIPTPTDVSVNPPPPVAKVVVPSRTAAVVPPRETVRAQDEAPAPAPQEAAVEKRPAPRPAAVAASPAPAAEKPRKVADAKAPEHKVVEHKAPEAKIPPAKVAAAKVAPAKVAAPKPAAATTTVAAATAPEPEETDILGVKLPSLAPAGRKIRDGVTALGDAVRSAF